MTDLNDDLEDLLKPQAGESALRDELLLRTERVLARARWLRRGAKIATVAAVFLVGGTVGWLIRPERERVVEVAGAERIVPVVVPLFLTQGADGAGSPSPPEPPLSATAAELQAEQTDDRAEAAKLYRVAGDRFLDQTDYRNATRCYRLFLVRAGDSGLSPERDDSWLLTSLKNAAFKEKTNVPTIRD